MRVDVDQRRQDRDAAEVDRILGSSSLSSAPTPVMRFADDADPAAVNGIAADRQQPVSV